MTWQDVLTAIREGKTSIPAAPNGVPLVSINALFYELMQLMEALTTGYNALVLRAASDPAAVGWISVDDMLPPKSGEYFTYGSGSGVYPLSYSAKHKAFNAHDCQEVPEYAIREVTHWYPRPLPPVTAETED